MGLVKKICLAAVVMLLAYFLSFQFGSLYDYFFPESLGGGLSTDAAYSIFGTPLAYVFFLTLLFTAFGGKHKYWWLGLLLIPAIIFELYFDSSHFYFPLALALLGWLIGFGVSKILKNRSNI